MMNSTASGSTTHQSGPAPAALDWGRGHYEHAALALVPAAQAVVTAAAVHAGERVLDLGCGSGNVALIAARAGAHVTAVDPAARLLEVTGAAAQQDGLDVQLRLAEASSLPFADASFDAVLSNFAVIFAPDPSAAIAEMARVVTGNGRIVFSAWLPGGTLGQLNATAMDMVRKALGAPPPPTACPWHDPSFLHTAFAAHGMTVTLSHHELTFTGTSPAAYLEADRTTHPMAIAGYEVLERAGQAEQAREILLQILQDGNEDPQSFRSTSRYAVVTATTT